METDGKGIQAAVDPRVKENHAGHTRKTKA